jgi:hypothetical protein
MRLRNAMNRRPNLVRRFLTWRSRSAMAKRIARLTPEERTAILQKSNLEAALFQGEGFHIFRKDIKDMQAAYVDSVGEVPSECAEDWIIARWLEEQDRGEVS